MDRTCCSGPSFCPLSWETAGLKWDYSSARGGQTVWLQASRCGNGRPAFLALRFRRNAVPERAIDQRFSVAVVLPGHCPNLTPPRTGESAHEIHRFQTHRMRSTATGRGGADERAVAREVVPRAVAGERERPEAEIRHRFRRHRPVALL